MSAASDELHELVLHLIDEMETITEELASLRVQLNRLQRNQEGGKGQYWPQKGGKPGKGQKGGKGQHWPQKGGKGRQAGKAQNWLQPKPSEGKDQWQERPAWQEEEYIPPSWR